MYIYLILTNLKKKIKYYKKKQKNLIKQWETAKVEIIIIKRNRNRKSFYIWMSATFDRSIRVR